MIPLVSQTIWAEADEQIVPPQERRTWEVNGLRVGRIAGELPLEVEAAAQGNLSEQEGQSDHVLRGER